MNEQELDVIKARCDAATQGPWMVGDGSPERLYLGADAVMCDVRGVVCGRAIYGNSAYDKQTYADIEFIATARQDVPALLTEVERLSSELYDMYEDECALEALEMANECKILDVAAERWPLRMQKQFERLTRERDAAVKDLNDHRDYRTCCGICAHYKGDFDCQYDIDYDCCNWKWRGVPEGENV
jgi:hypothetical protein